MYDIVALCHFCVSVSFVVVFLTWSCVWLFLTLEPSRKVMNLGVEDVSEGGDIVCSKIR